MRSIGTWAGWCALVWWPAHGFAGAPSGDSVDSGAERVTLDFPREVEVQALIDYVSQTLDQNILYDESIRKHKVILRSPASIPKSSLLGLVRSVLRTKGLALVEDDQPGWLRVVDSKALPSYVQEIRREVTTKPATTTAVVTQVLELGYADPATVVSTVKPFLSTPGGSALALEGTDLLIITDYEATLARVIEIITLIDVPVPEATVEIVPVRHADAESMATRITAILTDKATFAEPRVTAEPALTITPDPDTKTIVLIGLPAQIAEAKGYLAKFDVATPSTATTRKRYSPRYVNATRIKSLAEALIGKSADAKTSSLDIYVDAESNVLYVTATGDQHAEIGKLVAELDASPPEAARPVRFYKLKNRDAAEVFETISALLAEGQSGLPETRVESVRPPINPGGGSARAGGGTGSMRAGMVSSRQPSFGQRSSPRAGALQAEGEDFKMTVDEATNALIVIAPVEMHAEIEKLVEKLDKRRPQVLIELTLISITASDSLALGIELESIDLGGGTDYLLFSMFGLSGIDPATGFRTPSAAPGFNGVLLTPDQVPILMQALATRAESRSLAAPRLLVSDNGSATLSSVEQAPFTSLNASDTVATTSFAGFADAGTTVTVTPRIGEGDHLTLDYQLTFSSFTGPASGVTAPPPRNSNSIASIVEVPDGYTVVVGGLLVENSSDSVAEVPFLGQIPGLGLLFQNSTKSNTKSRIYAFIKPTILRDDAFEDLKFLSAEQAHDAGVATNDPRRAQPMWMGSAGLRISDCGLRIETRKTLPADR